MIDLDNHQGECISHMCTKTLAKVVVNYELSSTCIYEQVCMFREFSLYACVKTLAEHVTELCMFK